jgi:hypothetical protein
MKTKDQMTPEQLKQARERAAKAREAKAFKRNNKDAGLVKQRKPYTRKIPTKSEVDSYVAVLQEVNSALCAENDSLKHKAIQYRAVISYLESLILKKHDERSSI